jgi:phosphoadenosine phosphosulfate reductase
VTPVLDESPQLLTSLEHASAESVISWAHRRFGAGLVLTASMQDCVLIDIAVRVVPEIEVVFLDTGFHFDQTLAFAEEVRSRYLLNLRVVRPESARTDQWRSDPDGCCAARKVAPLGRVLAGRSAWLSGLRRAESPLRATAPVVGWDARRGLLKLNPLASCTGRPCSAS